MRIFDNIACGTTRYIAQHQGTLPQVEAQGLCLYHWLIITDAKSITVMLSRAAAAILSHCHDVILSWLILQKSYFTIHLQGLNGSS